MFAHIEICHLSVLQLLAAYPGLMWCQKIFLTGHNTSEYALLCGFLGIAATFWAFWVNHVVLGMAGQSERNNEHWTHGRTTRLRAFILKVL